MNIDLLRVVDRAVGIPWVHFLSAFRRNRPPRDLRRALIVKLFGLGNLVMLTPAMRALRSAFPDLELDVLTFEQNAGAGRMYPHLISRSLLVPYRVFPLAGALARIIAERRGHYDLVIDAEQFIRYTAMASLLLAPRVLAGLPTPTSWKTRAYHVFIPYREDRPLAREYLDLAVEIGRRFGRRVEEPDALVAPAVDAAAAARAAELVPEGAIGVCVGGRADALAKRYPHWVPLLRAVKTLGRDLVFTGTADESAAVRAVQSEVGGIDLSGKISQIELVEVIRRCSLFLSNDTGPLHLAAACGVKVAGFFGPTDPKVYAPYTPDKLILFDPRTVPSITNRDEKAAGEHPVFWVEPGEAFTKIAAYA